ncbi:MAG TPA: ABC transporter permease, partial [Thermoanaerobaculia bacterium]|nr:ABC transporter permease [Thermoanaerobaculia bacterium]
GVLLNPLPYSQPEQLVMLWEEHPQKGYHHNTVSLVNFEDWHREARSFQGMAAWRQQEVVLSGQEEPVRLAGAMITSDFFPVLGVAPLLGRTFSAEEEKERVPVVLLSERLWRQRFGASREILGRSLLLDGKPHTVLGVMPDGFDRPITALFKRGDFWLPMAVTPRMQNRESRFLQVIARTAGDPRAAQAELTGIARQLADRYPENAGWEVSVIPLHEEIVKTIRPVLQVLWIGALMVLLIGCTNLANVLLARVAGREQELALRLSLGASRWQLFSLFAAEILILVLPGSLAGAALAWLGGRFLAYNYLQFLPRLEEVDFGGPVLWFTLLLAVVITLLTAALVVAQAFRPDLGKRLVQVGGRWGVSRGTRRMRDLLAVLQIVLTFPLLVSTILLMKSVQRLENVDLGFDPRGVVASQVILPESRYGDAGTQSAFYRELLERLEGIPGKAVRSAISDLPLSEWDTGLEFKPIGMQIQADGKVPSAQFRVVAPDYFLTTGIPRIRGRDFNDRDQKEAEPVFVVSQELSRRFFRGRDPIGERLSVDYFGRPVEGVVVGIVGNVRHGGPADELKPAIYATYQQFPVKRMTILVRSEGKLEAVAATLRSAIHGLDSGLPASELIDMESLYAEAIATPRFRALVLGILGFLALALAMLGIYGVVSYSTAIRKREIGVRMALGAKPSSILLMVLRQGAMLCLWGIGGGALLAIASGRFLASNLFGVDALDIGAYAMVAAFLVLIGVVASFKPASSAINLPPALVLKGE